MVSTRDPIGEDGGINLYAYCLGDPINYVDPFGNNSAVAIDGGIIRTIVIAIGAVVTTAGAVVSLPAVVVVGAVIVVGGIVAGDNPSVTHSGAINPEDYNEHVRTNREKKIAKRPKKHAAGECKPPPSEDATGKREADRESGHKEKAREGRGSADNVGGEGRKKASTEE